VLSHEHRLCGAHVAGARIRGACRTRVLLPYTCVRMILCQATRCGHFMARSGTRVIADDEHDCDMGDIDRMDEMLEAIPA
jgi:hypothetical protein